MLTKENGFSFPWRLPISFDREAAFALVTLLVTLLLVYSNSFQGEWHFDDFHTIVDNPNIRLKALTGDELVKTFYGPTYGESDQHITRPLAYASFAANYLYGGTDVRGYHVVNFVIHFAAACFLFLLIRATLTLPAVKERYGCIAYPVALLSTILWATSPLHVHAVTIIVQRMASMAGLAYVASLYFYGRARTASQNRPRIVFYTLCGTCALAAFATKENTAVLPIAFLLYDLFFIQGLATVSVKRTLKWSILPIAAVVVLGLIYTDFSLQRETYDAGVRPFSPLERLMTEGRVLFFYVSLLLYPIPSRLAFLHDIEISRGLIDPWTTLAAIVAIFLCLLFAVLKAKRYPLLSFAILFFFLNHLIEGSVIPLELIYEHRNYIPSMFLFVPIAYLMVRCLDYFSYHRAMQVFMAAGFALLLAFQGHTTFERNDIVRSDVHLWLDNVRKSPGLSRPHINLGNHYAEAGMYDEALAEFTTAITLNHDTNLRQLGLAHYNLGLLYLNHYNDDGKALGQFEQALEKFPDYPSALSALARMKLRMGHVDEAYELIREKVEKFPHNGKLLQTYGLILLKKGDYTGAVDAAKRSLEWDPKAFFSLSVIGEAYRNMGKTPLAILYWRDYLAQNASDARAHLALIELYQSAGDKEALGKSVMQLMYLKGEKSLTALLEESAQNPCDSVHVFRPAELHRIIRSVVLAQLE